MTENEEYYKAQAAYWDVVAEDSVGYPKEQALHERRRYLGLLGMLAIEDSDE